jgi:hypothetical protein
MHIKKFYEQKKQEANLFIKEVAKVTHKEETTVRHWMVYGKIPLKAQRAIRVRFPQITDFN